MITVKTLLKNTYYVTVYDDQNSLWFNVVWGIVVEDERKKFPVDGYVTSSCVLDVDLDLGYFFTKSGTQYIATTGVTSTNMMWYDFPLLQAGYSPDEIKDIRELQKTFPDMKVLPFGAPE